MINIETNLPGLQTYQLLNESVCDKLVDRLEHIRKNKLSENPNITFFKSQGYQSDNLLIIEDSDIMEFAMMIRYHLAKSFGLDQEDLCFAFLHFLDYGEQGFMEEHDHKDKEDLTFLLYLNDCDDGATVFYLNHANESSRNRSEIKIFPKKGKIAVFNATIPHRSEITTNSKKIFAGGLFYSRKFKRNF